VTEFIKIITVLPRYSDTRRGCHYIEGIKKIKQKYTLEQQKYTLEGDALIEFFMGPPKIKKFFVKNKKLGGYPLKIEEYANFKNIFKHTNFLYSGVFGYGEHDGDIIF
jgi:hypothetical protein